MLFERARIKPYVLQNRWHSSTGHDVSLLALLSPILSPNTFPPPSDVDGEQPRGVTYQPFWTLTGNQKLLQSDAVALVSAQRSLTPAQVVYAFVSQGLGLPGLAACVLSGTTDSQHMREAVAAVRAAEADPWDEAELASLRQEVYGE